MFYVFKSKYFVNFAARYFLLIFFFHLSVSRVKGRQIKVLFSHKILFAFLTEEIERKEENCVATINFYHFFLYSMTFLVCNSLIWINSVRQGFSCLSSLFRLMPFFFFECLCNSYKVLVIHIK